MTFMMQHCASDSTARHLCFKYTVNSLVVYHRRTIFNLVLRVVHAAYFLKKMVHVGLGEIYLQGALGFCESVFFKNGKGLVSSAVCMHPCIPRNRL